ncbi:MAG: hypothetical protein J6V58_01430 [Clostridia bacterium]|nr:hypothetical protein [Clostridia bacterium]
MKNIKDITFMGLFVALLISAQYVLSFISGVEVITVLLLCYCYVFGSSKGVIVSTVFSITRCLVFGFNINVIILYLIYYNLFALFFGYLGKRTGSLSLIVSGSVVFTILFTMIDNIITPLILGFSKNAAITYMLYSVYTCAPQIICTFVTVSLLFKPLTKVLYKFKNS